MLAGSVCGSVVERLPFVGPDPSGTNARTLVRSYAGPVSAHGRGIDTGVFTRVATVVSWHCGRPSGAQSGLPSKRFAVVSRKMGLRLLLSDRSITRSPLVKVPST